MLALEALLFLLCPSGSRWSRRGLAIVIGHDLQHLLRGRTKLEVGLMGAEDIWDM